MVQWYNEGRAIRDAKMLAYAKRQVVELDSIADIDPENDGILVHITGHVTTDGGLTDPKSGLVRPYALQLRERQRHINGKSSGTKEQQE